MKMLQPGSPSLRSADALDTDAARTHDAKPMPRITEAVPAAPSDAAATTLPAKEVPAAKPPAPRQRSEPTPEPAAKSATEHEGIEQTEEVRALRDQVAALGDEAVILNAKLDAANYELQRAAERMSAASEQHEHELAAVHRQHTQDSADQRAGAAAASTAIASMQRANYALRVELAETRRCRLEGDKREKERTIAMRRMDAELDIVKRELARRKSELAMAQAELIVAAGMADQLASTSQQLADTLVAQGALQAAVATLQAEKTGLANMLESESRFKSGMLQELGTTRAALDRLNLLQERRGSI